MIRFAIMADDLSGACDTAVTFSNYGYRSLVLNFPEGCQQNLAEYDVVSISTNSREIPQQEAKERIIDTCRFLKRMGITNIYKKIDSTWRGNIGPELEALMEEMGLSLLIICSAFPQTGRLIDNGILKINGVPLEHTPIALDPGFSIKDSYLPGILQKQTGIPVALINHDIVNRGSRALSEKLLAISKQGRAVVLVDALNERDLDTIVSIEASILPPFLFCGSAGLSGAMIRKIGVHYQSGISPVIVFVGSVHPQNLVMVEYLTRNKLAEDVFLNPVSLLEGQIDHNDLAKMRDILARGRDLIIRTFRGEQDRETTDSAGKRNGYSEIETAYCIAQKLQEIVRCLLWKYPCSGLMITGGTTALHVLRGIEGVGIEVKEELEPGISCGCIVGGPLEGLGIITKAGGFGTETTLARGIKYLKQKNVLRKGIK